MGSNPCALFKRLDTKKPCHTLPHAIEFPIRPHIMINGAAKALEFYMRALGATEVFRISTPNGKFVHAEVAIGASIIMVGDADGPFRDPQSIGGTSVGLHT